jgi:hypothetical protein
MSRKDISDRKKARQASLAMLEPQAPNLQLLHAEVPEDQARQVKKRKRKVVTDDFLDGEDVRGRRSASEPIVEPVIEASTEVPPIQRDFAEFDQGTFEDGEFRPPPVKTSAGPSRPGKAAWLSKSFIRPDPTDLEACQALGDEVCRAPKLKRLGTLEDQIPHVGTAILDRNINHDALKKLKGREYNSLSDHLGYSIGEVCLLITLLCYFS